MKIFQLVQNFKGDIMYTAVWCTNLLLLIKESRRTIVYSSQNARNFTLQSQSNNCTNELPKLNGWRMHTIRHYGEQSYRAGSRLIKHGNHTERTSTASVVMALQQDAHRMYIRCVCCNGAAARCSLNTLFHFGWSWRCAMNSSREQRNVLPLKVVETPTALSPSNKSLGLTSDVLQVSDTCSAASELERCYWLSNNLKSKTECNTHAYGWRLQLRILPEILQSNILWRRNYRICQQHGPFLFYLRKRTYINLLIPKFNSKPTIEVSPLSWAQT
jgi:hypothetical protein